LNGDETTNTNYFQRLLQRQVRPPLPLQQRPPFIQREEQRAQPFMQREEQRAQPFMQREEQRAQPFMQREEQRAQPFMQREEQRAQPYQNEGDPNYVSYDTIQIATKLIPFCTIDNPKNEICPISQIQFKEIDCIMQINHCKHNFNPYSLFRWFDSSSTCPMCRYNLNSYSNEHGNHPSEMIESESESESEYD
jgi:hypothetical protein